MAVVVSECAAPTPPESLRSDAPRATPQPKDAMSQQPPSPTVSWLPWAFAVACVLAGWLTPAQVCITIALEIALAAHHGRRRTQLSAGVIVEDGGQLSTNERTLTLTAGTRLSEEERQFYGKNMQILLTGMAVMSAGLITALGAWSGVTTVSLVGWLAWTTAALWSERRSFQAWAASDAPATSDPTGPMNPPFHRAVLLFLSTWFALVLGQGMDDGGAGRFAALLLLLGDSLVLLWWPRRQARRAARAAADAPRVVHQRLPVPDPAWRPESGWTPPAGWYGRVPGWELQDGTWRRTAEHPHGPELTEPPATGGTT